MFTAKFSKDQRKIIIEIDVEEEFLPSKKSGMTLLIASTHGTQQSTAVIDGQRVRISANAFVPNPAYIKRKDRKRHTIDLGDF